MVKLRRAQIVNLVEHSYFSNIDFRRLGTVLDCFAHDAVLLVGGVRHEGRDGAIKQYIEGMLAAHSAIRHEVASLEVDEAGQRLDCRFTLRLEDAEGRACTSEGRAAFRLENGKLASVEIETDGDGPSIRPGRPLLDRAGRSVCSRRTDRSGVDHVIGP